MDLSSAVSQINWIAVIAATVASFFLGYVWFALLFGKAYAASLGKAFDPSAKPEPLFMYGPFLCGLVSTVTSAVLINALSVQSISEALIFGGLIGIGYLSATTINTGINPNIPRPLFYGLISGSYFLISNVIVWLILVSFK